MMPIIDEKEVAWLAGILEGEGCFDWAAGERGKNRYPRIRIEMKDEDIVKRVKDLIGGLGEVRPRKHSNPNYSTTYVFQVTNGKIVRSVLEQIRPWMSERRRAKIDLLLKATD